ncbi:Peptide chain release factor 1 [Wickerhamomyces ciferrii]|uniref:Peptide chain release factor 1, mitochondrial n=1 Tax=Wickerhamomyces ciferrii (strain ATCC 14091 / BCRC 22168 / CBS 111 / JCM 3599 / NBRC 0793 / NRRL Y-1031 F-60-10) TaxID=1206466 RepID=K0KIS4_WICCF|nr:Peptide chain release factor 1 [Wickerhamomyces ciferrii]CCH41299.1 Peptide chain release factor 1 [Wickerhamomyces ciferrii]
MFGIRISRTAIPSRSNFIRPLFQRFNSTTSTTFQPLHPALIKRAQQLTQELKDLEASLADGGHFDINQQKKYSRLSMVVDIYRDYSENVTLYEELQLLLEDESLKDEAEQEIETTLPKLVELADKLKSKLLPPHEFAEKACLLELRPGVGGIEAMIFTSELFQMYINYANHKRWQYSVVSKSMNGSGNGILEGILSIDEPGSYDKLRFESGVHRVQRIPETETKGRLQTSTAGVVVLPQMSDNNQSEDADERVFAQGEVRIDVMRSSGKGGQHVNTTESAVRLTHIPTGITVSMQDERSQQKNKSRAFAVLRSRIAEKERVEREAAQRSLRSDQVSTTDRSDKIRTYNFPQNRITDHRCSYSLHDAPGVMRGEKLDLLIDALEKHEGQVRSKELENMES